MNDNGGPGNNELPRDLRALSEKLSQAHEATKKRHEAKYRFESMCRRYLFTLYAAVIAVIAVEFLIGLYFSVIPGSSGYYLWVPGTLRFIVSAALLSLVVLAGLLFAAPKQLAMYVRGRSLTGRASGVVLNTDAMELTPPSGKERYLIQTGYVYEIAGVRRTGSYRSGDASYKAHRKFNRTRTLFPPGKVVEVFYDPGNPTSSSLKKGPGRIAAAAMALALLVTTWLVSAGIIILFMPFAPLVAISLGAVMLFGANKRHHQFQSGY